MPDEMFDYAAVGARTAACVAIIARAAGGAICPA
jgi:hypothetical protein